MLAVVRRAAEIEGPSLSDFLLGAAQEAARGTIEQAQIIRLSMDGAAALCIAAAGSPALAPAMKRAAQAHQKLIASKP